MNRKYKILTTFFLFAIFLVIAHSGGVGDKPLKITYPRDGSVFPPEIAAPTITWEDSSRANTWTLTVEIEKNKPFVFNLSEKKWKPERKLWELIKSNSFDNPARLSVKNNIGNEDYIALLTSRDSINAPIFYRDVPLPFSYALRHLNEVRWRIGDISSDSLAPVAMENLPVCANCHSFSADGSTIAMDVDAHSGKDAYGIAKVEKHTILHKMVRWSFFQQGEPTYGLLSNISPNGRYIASTLKDNEFFVVQPNVEYSQLFFPIKGIVVIYDQQKDRFFSLPGADDTNFVQSNPNWAPDGKDILFTRAKAIKSAESGFQTAFDRDSVKYQSLVNDFYSRKREFKYDIFKIPFNNEKGGKAVPLAGASGNGKSNYYPRISPDNKWLVYTQADNFMLLQPDSKLYILPAEGGTPRLMKCNMSNMNSWHSWSPNGRWLIFSSKEQGPFTKLYLTHIDENGNDSPPILLENMWLPDRAANIPEFVNVRPGGFVKLEPKFLENDYFSFQTGIKKIEDGDLKGAIAEFDKAAAMDPGNFMVYGARGYAKAELGDNKGALEDYNKALLLNPNDFKLYNLRGFIRVEFEDYKGAISDFSKSIELNKLDFEPYNGRGYVNVLTGNFKIAIEDFNKALQLNNRYVKAYFQRGIAYYNLKEFTKALSDFNKAIDLDRNYGPAYLYRGLGIIETGGKDKACADFQTALRLGVAKANEAIKAWCNK